MTTMTTDEKWEAWKKEHGGYWAGYGSMQSDYDRMWSEYVPESGEVIGSKAGEAVRRIARINYELYNNGCCNYTSDAAFDEDEGFDACIGGMDYIEDFEPSIRFTSPTLELLDLERVEEETEPLMDFMTAKDMHDLLIILATEVLDLQKTYPTDHKRLEEITTAVVKNAVAFENEELTIEP